MARYQITLKDRSIETVDGVDTYQPEGQMTTFYTTRPGRETIDAWSTRVASFRTAEVVIIRRLDVPTEVGATGDGGARLRSA